MHVEQCRILDSTSLNICLPLFGGPFLTKGCILLLQYDIFRNVLWETVIAYTHSLLQHSNNIPRRDGRITFHYLMHPVYVHCLHHSCVPYCVKRTILASSFAPGQKCGYEFHNFTSAGRSFLSGYMRCKFSLTHAALILPQFSPFLSLVHRTI